ncbi:MAG: YfhO family protein [Anaerolineae bacterium]
MKRSVLLEWLIIAGVGLLYWSLLAPSPTNILSTVNDALRWEPLTQLTTDSTVRPDALEQERLAGSILPIKVGLERFGQIPAWNPLLANGVPLINNPFNYLFNPFHSLPVLIWGGVQGSKLVMLLTFIIAGWGMWTLGYAIGFVSAARVMMALFYMLNGSLSAKFGAGHFQLANSLAWPPFVFAGLWWTLHSEKRTAPIMVGIAFALLFYAGNIYYVLHTLVCCGVLAAVHVINRREGRWRLGNAGLGRIVTAGLFAFGLSALQFFPVWQTREFVTHQQQVINPDGRLEANYDLQQSFANLTIAWPEWSASQQISAGALLGAVDYAYIGLTPFAFMLAALLLALVRREWVRSYFAERRGLAGLVITASLLAVAMMVWSGGQFAPLTWSYAHIPLLAEFRYVGRALAFADLWWIVAGGIALDFLWTVSRERFKQTTILKATKNVRTVRAVGLALAVWVYLLVYSAADVETRLNMTLRNLQWWQRLDGLRFTTLAQAVEGLFILVGVMLVVDMVLLLIEQLLMRRIVRQRWSRGRYTGGRLASRGVHTLLRLVVLAGVWDVMRSNAATIHFVEVGDPYANVFPVIHELDSGTPYPAVKLPFSGRDYSPYEHLIRNWGTNEGWLPAAATGILSDQQHISNLPRWGVIVRDRQGNIPTVGDLQFLQESGYELRGCFLPDRTDIGLCQNRPNEVALYEYPLALPYAFTVANTQLIEHPAELNAQTVQAGMVVHQEMDRISIQAQAEDRAQWLVVQEANFPGWQAQVDGQDVPLSTVQTGYKDEQTLGLIAVQAQAGEHTYTFRFEPPGFKTGVVVFVFTVMAGLGYVLIGRKRNS